MNTNKLNKNISLEKINQQFFCNMELKACSQLYAKDYIKIPYHSQLFYFIENNEHPDIIIIFIYKHLYELIEETQLLNDDSYKQLYFVYSDYYQDQEKSKWFITLFPSVDKHLCFSFKKFYIGLVGRIHRFSFDTKDPYYIKYPSKAFPFFWYGDPEDWTISYHLYINTKNELKINKCKFFVFDEYKAPYNGLELLNRYKMEFPDYVYMLVKKYICEPMDENEHLEYHLLKDIVDTSNFCIFSEYEDLNKFYSRLIKYKENVNQESGLCLNTPENKKYKKKLEKNYSNFVACEYAKEIKYLGYNSDLGDIWYKYQKEKKELEQKELKRRLKLIKLSKKI